MMDTRGRPLLTRLNPKILKGEKQGYLTHILHLAPADLSGRNTCAAHTPGCKAACLNTAGRSGIIHGDGKLNRQQSARLWKTQFFFDDQYEFMDKLVNEIFSGIRHALKRGLIPVFRLNGTSDIRWERVNDGRGMAVMHTFPKTQFYDYTKIANRKNLPDNYKLTFSLAENNETEAQRAIKAGMNVAVVFRTKNLPPAYMGLPVFNGDESDLRFLDPPGHIIGLYAKGKGKQDRSGFVKETQ